MTVYGNGSKIEPPRGGNYGDPRPGGRRHEGTDYVGYEDLKATDPGVVTFAGWFNNAAGNAVVYDIDERGPNGEIITIYRFHPDSIAVRKGQRITEGQYLGAKGDTGNAVGECDHIEIRYWKNGTYKTVDPRAWFAARVGGHKPQTPGYANVNLDNIVSVLGGEVRGLQYIAYTEGYRPIDNDWGPNSKRYFQQFLNKYYGGSIVTWLTKRWGYSGNSQLGPVMTAAIRRANNENLAVARAKKLVR